MSQGPLQRIDEAPSLASFMGALAAKEGTQEVLSCAAADLSVDQAGFLLAAGRSLPLAERAARDLACIARIPPAWFMGLGTELRALLLQRRFLQFALPAWAVQVVVQDGAAVRVLLAESYHPPRGPLLAAVATATPQGFAAASLKVLIYEEERAFDIALVEPSLHASVRPGDVVAGGVGLVQGPDGSVEIAAACLRLTCMNGSLVRLQAGARHRLSRPGSDRQSQEAFRAAVEERACQAWAQFSANAAGLARLAQARVDDAGAEELMARLRRPPFSLPARAAQEVAGRLGREAAQAGGELTLFDAWNAASWLGSHEARLPWRARFLLRLGAGTLARSHAAGVCPACGQATVERGHAVARGA